MKMKISNIFLSLPIPGENWVKTESEVKNRVTSTWVSEVTKSDFQLSENWKGKMNMIASRGDSQHVQQLGQPCHSC